MISEYLTRGRLNFKGIERITELAFKKAENPNVELHSDDLHLLSFYKNENPQKFPAFKCDGLDFPIYAVNKVAADQKAARILRKPQNR